MTGATQENNLSEIWTVRQVASYLQVDRKTAYVLVRDHGLPVRKVGKGLRFKRGDVLRWLDGKSCDLHSRRKSP
jgi:excisionase family DNA binding protein